MLRLAVVGLQARKVERRVLANLERQRNCGRAGLDTAAVMADVDLDKDIDLCCNAGSRAGLVHDGGQPRDAVNAVDISTAHYLLNRFSI